MPAAIVVMMATAIHSSPPQSPIKWEKQETTPYIVDHVTETFNLHEPLYLVLRGVSGMAIAKLGEYDDRNTCVADSRIIPDTFCMRRVDFDKP